MATRLPSVHNRISTKLIVDNIVHNCVDAEDIGHSSLNSN